MSQWITEENSKVIFKFSDQGKYRFFAAQCELILAGVDNIPEGSMVSNDDEQTVVFDEDIYNQHFRVFFDY